MGSHKHLFLSSQSGVVPARLGSSICGLTAEEVFGQTLQGHDQTDSDHDTVHTESSPCWAEAGNWSWLHERGIAPPETPKIQLFSCAIEV